MAILIAVFDGILLLMVGVIAFLILWGDRLVVWGDRQEISERPTIIQPPFISDNRPAPLTHCPSR